MASRPTQDARQAERQATFVTPWYGQGIPGGAEAAARDLAVRLADQGVRVRVLTTWLKGLGTDWANDHFAPGIDREGPVEIRRFACPPRNLGRYNQVLARIRSGGKVSAQDEHDLFANMVHSPGLLDHLRNHPQEGPFFFIPYLFTTSVWGPLIHPDLSVLIPCLHNEGFARMKAVRRAFEAARAVAFNSPAERDLGLSLYDLDRERAMLTGLGLDTGWTADASRFRRKYGISGPFILYAGRKDAAKNVPLLVEYFLRYVRSQPAVPDLKLVMVGNLEAPIPPGGHEHIMDLGFVPMQDKYDAYGAAQAFVHPSLMESFSFVIMESWLAGTPVLVNSGCAVTRDHVTRASGGLHFGDYPHFAESLNLLLTRPELGGDMAARGREYVLANYDWPVVIDRYLELIDEIGSDAAERMVAPRAAQPEPKPEPDSGPPPTPAPTCKHGMGLRATFVLPWFGPEVPGGAETEARRTAQNLAEAGVAVQVLTTRLGGLGSEWDSELLPEGITWDQGVRVVRFNVAPRDGLRYNALHGMIQAGEPLSPDEEREFFANMVNSPELMDHIARHPEEGPFFFIPYLFTTSVWGPLIHPAKSVIIPCLHDEAYARLRSVAAAFETARAMIFHVPAERDLAAALCDLGRTEPLVLGEGMSIDWSGSAERFRRKFNINGPFILYAGRKDATKNLPLLIHYFLRYVGERDGAGGLKLVMIGNLTPDLPPGAEAHIRDLGFLGLEDKHDAYGAALALAQPSLLESFSRVIMESWLAGAPVLVHGDCAVTRSHVEISGGGLHFNDYPHFAESLDILVSRPELAEQMGRAGRRYVEENFSWPVVTGRYLDLIKRLAEEPVPEPKEAFSLPQPGTARVTRPMAVHQVVPEFAFGDAIGNEAQAIQKLLQGWGYCSEIYAATMQRRVADRARHLNAYAAEIGPDDVVIAHFSIGHEFYQGFGDLPGRKVLRYHNITPAEFMEPVDPAVAGRCRLGREQLARLAPQMELGIAVSPFNQEELDAAGCPSSEVVPIVLDLSTLSAPANPRTLLEYRDGRPLVLHVGRMAPNKRIEDLVKTHYWLSKLVPGVRLALAGSGAGMESYLAGLRRMIYDLGAPGVRLLGHVSVPTLNALYRAADLYLCLSEHEGFCVPLVEAMHCGVPIMAYAAAGVPGTLGDGGMLLPQKDPVKVAEAAARVINDPDLSAAMAAAGTERMKHFLPRAVTAKLARVLEHRLGLETGPC